MAGPQNRYRSRQLQPGRYSRWRRLRLWRAFALAGVGSIGLACGACSFPLDSMFGSADKSETTGSITPPPGAKQAALPPDADMAYARIAVSDVLSRPTNDASVPWENPHSGARGTVTSIAAAYSQAGETCRDFLASYISGATQSWLQGEACKQAKGNWEVRSMKPWKRS